MKTYVLIQFTAGAHLVWIYGTITAEDEHKAAASVSSKVIRTHQNGALNIRHELDETGGTNTWFLEEVKPVRKRPLDMA
jgi:hypothetical protein